MPLYPFETQLVVSADASHVVMTNAVVTIYDPSDTGMANPLALTDLNGLPIANPIGINPNGFLPAFQASVPQVMWVGGGYSGYLGSYKGILDEAVAARIAAATAASVATGAQAAAEQAQAAAKAAATAPTDSAIDARLAASGTPGKWKPNTAYVTDQYVINPSGELVKATFAHTSGASYDEANWTTGSLAALGTMPLNVKDARFGAKGDGTTDDTAAIQAALDAVGPGGRAVYLPAGRYKITSTLKVTQDGTTLYGDGTGNRAGATQNSIGSRLEAAGTITGSVLLVQRAANDRPLQGVSLRDFTVEGGLVGSNVDGIIFRVNQGHIDRVHIWRCSGAGLRVIGYSSPGWDTYDTVITSSIIGMCVGSGAVLDARAADTHWSHCVFLNNYDNFVVKGASPQVTGCHFYTPERHDILFDGSGSRAKFANCKIEGAKNHMVLIDSTNGGYSDIQFTGCGFSSLNSGTLDNTYDYVLITGPSTTGVSRTTFVGNSFNLKGGSLAKARYAINLENACAQGTVIIGNSFGPPSHWGTAALNNKGSTAIPATIKANANVPDNVNGSAFLNAADFGAKGNGTADDTAAIQAALDAAATKNGATVWLPPGSYLVTSSLVIGNDNTTLRGAGAGSKAGSYPGMGSRITASGSAFTGPVISIARPDGVRAVYAPKLVDLAIDCQLVLGPDSVPVNGLGVTAVRGDFDNVSIWAASGHGVFVKGIDSSNTSTGNRFRAVVSSDHVGTGFHVDTLASDNSFQNCIADQNNRGMQLLSSRTAVVGCDFNRNQTAVYLADGGNNSRFTATKFRSSFGHGVELSAATAGISEVSFLGCHFDGNGTTTTNTADHLYVQGSASFAVSRLAIVGCSFTSTAANKPRYGVNFASSAVQSALVVANMFGSSSHFGTAPLINSSASSLKNRIVGNINVPDVQDASTVTAAYTLAAPDVGTMIDVNSASAVTVTVPSNSAVPLPTGSVIKLTQIGAGQVTIAPDTGVTLNTARTLTTRAQFSTIELRKRATDVWVVSGDLT